MTVSWLERARRRGWGVTVVRPVGPAAFGSWHRLQTPVGTVDAEWQGSLCCWVVREGPGVERRIYAEAAGDLGWRWLHAIDAQSGRRRNAVADAPGPLDPF